MALEFGCYVLVVDPYWLAQVVAEMLMEWVGETEVEEWEAVNTVRWPCFKACDRVVL
jgi:hypothetical protein